MLRRPVVEALFLRNLGRRESLRQINPAVISTGFKIRVIPPPASLFNLSRSFSTAKEPAASEQIVDYFVLPPPPSVSSNPSVEPLSASESLTDIGLGGYWPPGLVQHGYDFLHSLGLPWWGCIVVGAVAVRTMMVPLFAAVQKNSVNMFNHAPEIQQFQVKLLAAHSRGDRVGALKLLAEQKQFMKDHDISHLGQIRLMLVQMSVFVSMFFGLKEMAQLPIESLKTGGLFHVVDLTTRDPLFILPVVTCATMYFIITKGAEGANLELMPRPLQYLFKLMPFAIFFPAAYFPSALALYWMTSNIFSLFQFYFFKSDFAKNFFGLPDRREISPENLPHFSQHGFAESFATATAAAQEGATTAAKINSMKLPDDKRDWQETVLGRERTAKEQSLSAEELAARHGDIRKIVKEMREMKEKINSLEAKSKVESKNLKTLDEIHIRIPKDKSV